MCKGEPNRIILENYSGSLTMRSLHFHRFFIPFARGRVEQRSSVVAMPSCFPRHSFQNMGYKSNSSITKSHNSTALKPTTMGTASGASVCCPAQMSLPFTSTISHVKYSTLFKQNESSFHNLKCTSLLYSLLSEQRRNAGHSKWANIKHIKAAKDSQRASVTTKLVNSMRVAIREGGSANPNANLQLARVIAQANKADVPKSVIENTIKNAVKANEEGTIVYLDAKVPGGFMMIIEVFTSNTKRTKKDIYTAFKKVGGQLSDKPISGHFFDYKGVVLAMPGGSLTNLENAEEAAIIAEAEEVEDTFDDNGNPVYQFICDPKAVHSTHKALVEQHSDVEFTKPTFRYIPKVHATLTEAGIEQAAILIDTVENIDDVVRVYTNIQTEDQS